MKGLGFRLQGFNMSLTEGYEASRIGLRRVVLGFRPFRAFGEMCIPYGLLIQGHWLVVFSSGWKGCF